MKTTFDPLHQADDGHWYFWDRRWLFVYGPYDDMSSAQAAIVEYRQWLESREIHARAPAR